MSDSKSEISSMRWEIRRKVFWFLINLSNHAISCLVSLSLFHYLKHFYEFLLPFPTHTFCYSWMFSSLFIFYIQAKSVMKRRYLNTDKQRIRLYFTFICWAHSHIVWLGKTKLSRRFIKKILRVSIIFGIPFLEYFYFL